MALSCVSGMLTGWSHPEERYFLCMAWFGLGLGLELGFGFGFGLGLGLGLGILGFEVRAVQGLRLGAPVRVREELLVLCAVAAVVDLLGLG